MIIIIRNKSINDNKNYNNNQVLAFKLYINYTLGIIVDVNSGNDDRIDACISVTVFRSILHDIQYI